MPKGVAYHVDEDPPEWIEECMQCPFDECVDCRYQASAYHCVTSIRGCMQEEKFISMIRNNVCFSGREFLIFLALTFKFFLLLLPFLEDEPVCFFLLVLDFPAIYSSKNTQSTLRLSGGLIN